MILDVLKKRAKEDVLFRKLCACNDTASSDELISAGEVTDLPSPVKSTTDCVDIY